LFSPSDGLGKSNHQTPGKLVIEKYDNWKKAKDVFKDHENNYHHKLSQSKFDNFYAVQNNKVDSVCTQINVALKKEKKKRARLRLIIKTILFCGQQRISLRGHKDCIAN
jgi:hypothetical protein